MSLEIPGISLPTFDLGNEPIIGPLIKPVEVSLVSLGMTTPSRRMVGITLATGVILWATKPARFFENGKPRPWSMWNNEDLNSAPVAVPWWLAAILSGTFAGVFL